MRHINTKIDHKIAFGNIAKSKQLTFNELLHEMETIVSSGTRLNIGYYLDDAMDPEKQEEVIEYFRENESEQLTRP